MTDDAGRRVRGGTIFGLTIALASLGACDRGATPANDAAPASAPTPAAAEVAAGPPAAGPPGPVAAPGPDRASEPVVPAAPAPEPPKASPADETFAALAERLSAGLPPTDAPHETGFKHYKAGSFAEAQPYFALAAIRDGAAWKHPFNLACAAARRGDEAIARVALVEAVRRGGATVVAKARRDADLAAVRSSAWFEPVLRGEAWPSASPTPPPASDAPTPDAPAPDPAPTTATDAPAPTPVGPKRELPRGSKKPLSAAALRELVDALTAIHHAKPVVKASLEHPGADGEATGWAIYQYSRFDACVGEQPDPKKARRTCRRQLGPLPDEDDPGTLECTDQWLVRLTPTSPVTVLAREKLNVACTLRKVRRLDALDLDGDGRDEVLVDVTGEYESEGFREGPQKDHGRVARVLRLDGTVQFAFDRRWTSYDMGHGTEDAKRFELRDADGDGHADVIVFTREYAATTEVELDDEQWPDGDADEDRGPITSAVWRYDAARDAWIEPDRR